jgi:hypothetical protein
MLLLLAAFGIQVKALAVQTPLAAADRSGPRVDILAVRSYCHQAIPAAAMQKHPPWQVALKIILIF